ncbi:hypothetical protein SAMN04488498_1658 [Mesorhizobium albiziae]|uniref:Uncharacterized protein n=1 Tax=Neomesorhizobium albiziae TaxID=335020 RepID=A0A1I4G092_9HYPH|nr:hypothetical protein SAMN04488498_1658 [Mesorhizobium albiziae]
MMALPPEISVEKRRHARTGWAYYFRHHDIGPTPPVAQAAQSGARPALTRTLRSKTMGGARSRGQDSRKVSVASVRLLSPSPRSDGITTFHRGLGQNRDDSGTWRRSPSGYMPNPRGHMQHPKRPFTVEIRSSRNGATRRDRGSIWANVNLKKARREIEQDLRAEQTTGPEPKSGTAADPISS